MARSTLAARIARTRVHDVPLRSLLYGRIARRLADPDANGCRLWTGARSGDGYGYIKVAGVVEPVHRVIFLLSGRELPDDHDVHHTCGVRPCGESSHLQAAPAELNRYLGFRNGIGAA